MRPCIRKCLSDRALSQDRDRDNLASHRARGIKTCQAPVHRTGRRPFSATGRRGGYRSLPRVCGKHWMHGDQPTMFATSVIKGEDMRTRVILLFAAVVFLVSMQSQLLAQYRTDFVCWAEQK